MSYKMCLEKAGAKILDFQEFGSYQGEWLAFVEYKGQRGIVQGSYGSCSCCDAFEAEFGYNNTEPEEYDGKYYKNGNTWDDNCECSKEEYEQALKEYDKRLADFGRDYLEAKGVPCLYDKAHYERRLSGLDSEDWFSDEEKEYIQWAISRNW